MLLIICSFNAVLLVEKLSDALFQEYFGMNMVLKVFYSKCFCVSVVCDC